MQRRAVVILWIRSSWCEHCGSPAATLYEFGHPDSRIRQRPDNHPGKSIRVCVTCRPIFEELPEDTDLSALLGAGKKE